MKSSGISWTHNTWNPWVGCDKVAPECAHCYIGREVRKQIDWQSVQAIKPLRQPWGKVYLTKTWADPHRWQGELQPGTCKRVFTCSLSDFFIAKADNRSVCPPGYESAISMAMRQHRGIGQRAGSTKWRDLAWQVIRETPQLVYLILTKRPELITARLPKGWPQAFPNVWLGTSVGCKQTLNKLDSLRQIPIHPDAVRFLSCEPLLENISEGLDLSGIGWVICGGESGENPEYLWDASGDWKKELHDAPGGRRTMDLLWAHRLRRKAWQHRIPFWFKQVTAGRSGKGEDALGRVIHEVPPPPYGEWAPMEENELVVLG